MIKEKIVSTEEEDIQKAISGAIRVLSLENEIKDLKMDIKAIKDELKDEGITVKNFNKALSMIKQKIKEQLKPIDSEAELFARRFEEDDNVQNLANKLLGE